MVGDDDVDDAAPQHWRMRQQHRISVQLQWDELYLMKRILVAWMISVVCVFLPLNIAAQSKIFDCIL